MRQLYNRNISHAFLENSKLNGLCPSCWWWVEVIIADKRIFCRRCNDQIWITI